MKKIILFLIISLLANVFLTNLSYADKIISELSSSERLKEFADKERGNRLFEGTKNLVLGLGIFVLAKDTLNNWTGDPAHFFEFIFYGGLIAAGGLAGLALTAAGLSDIIENSEAEKKYYKMLSLPQRERDRFAESYLSGGITRETEGEYSFQTQLQPKVYKKKDYIQPLQIPKE